MGRFSTCQNPRLGFPARRTGLCALGHLGLEWSPMEALSIRVTVATENLETKCIEPVGENIRLEKRALGSDSTLST